MKKLIAYFSATGTTKRAAARLKEEVEGDIFEITPKEVYTRADLDWTDSRSRSSVEIKNDDCRPLIVDTVDTSEYDTIYIGFPIWWGIAPNVVKTFLDSIDLNNKTIITFCTSGGSPLEPATKDLMKTYPNANIVNGKRMY